MNYRPKIENYITKKLRGMVSVLRGRNVNLNQKLEKLKAVHPTGAKSGAADFAEGDTLVKPDQLQEAKALITQLEGMLKESRDASKKYRKRLLRTQERFREMREMVLVERDRVKTTRDERNQARKLASGAADFAEGDTLVKPDQLQEAKALITQLKGMLKESRDASKKSRERLLRTQERFREMREMVLVERDRVKTTRDERNQARMLADEREAASLFFYDLMAGVDENTALLRFVRNGSSGSGRIMARAFSHWLYQSEDRKDFGAIALGSFLVSDELFGASVQYFTEAGFKKSWELVPIEVMTAILGEQGERGLAEARDWIAKQDINANAAQLYQALQVLIRFGYFDDARDLCARLNDLPNDLSGLNDEQHKDIDWMARRLVNGPHENKFYADSDAINIAVMDYKLIDRQRTSSNRGDYVQTLAALSNILRFQDVEFSGEGELNGYLNELKPNIHEDRRISLGKGTIKAAAFPLDRDFASGRTYPENTWLLCNGWFMHRNFKGNIDFPFPDTVNPIFLSFHLNDPAVMNKDVAAQLKKFEPIGCRDWTTVYRLREFGVSCFFSGCLTTSIGQIMPKADQATEDALALVESRVSSASTEGWRVDKFSQVGDYVREFTLVEGLKDADTMLRGYLPYSKIKTSRLHCYLPCRSMGFEVDFEPRNRSDIRFEGLLDLTPEALLQIRTRIEDKLETVFRAIFEGKSRDEVMAVWREICAPEVAEADEYIRAYSAVEVSHDETSKLVEQIKITSIGEEADNAIHTAFATDQNLMGYFPTVLQSALDHASRPLVVHFMYRDLPQEYLDSLESAFPGTAFRLYDMSAVEYGDQVRMLEHTTISTMDRCLLPEVMQDQQKVAYLDIDILIRADLADMYDVDLTNHFLAGKLSNLKSWTLVVKLATRGSLFLEPEQAWDLRRRLHGDHTLYQTTFNAGVIVMNLEKMREQQFAAHAMHLISHCHLNDQDVLNIFGASNNYELEPDWNYVPAQDYSTDPKIVHWAGTIKSWSPEPILWKHEFLEVAQRAPDVAGYTWRGIE